MGRRVFLLLLVLITSGWLTPPSCADGWQVKNITGLCQDIEIREGPGFGCRAHTIVLENDWAVKIIDGPRYVNGEEWWDTSRWEAGDLSGGTGWVYRHQAESCKSAAPTSAPPAQGVLVTGLSITPSNPQPNQTVNARFTVQPPATATAPPTSTPIPPPTAALPTVVPRAIPISVLAQVPPLPQTDTLCGQLVTDYSDGGLTSYMYGVVVTCDNGQRILVSGSGFGDAQYYQFEHPVIVAIDNPPLHLRGGDVFYKLVDWESAQVIDGCQQCGQVIVTPTWTPTIVPPTKTPVSLPTPVSSTLIPTPLPTPVPAATVVPPTATAVPPSSTPILSVATPTSEIPFGCAGFGQCATPTPIPTFGPGMPADVRITAFTLADTLTVTGFAVMQTPYVWRQNTAWIQVTNVGQSPFNAPYGGGQYTLQVILKRRLPDGSLEFVHEQDFVPGTPGSLEPLGSLLPEESQTLQVSELFFLHPVENGVLEVLLHPAPALNLSDLSRDIVVTDHPDSICACLARVAQAVLKVASGNAAVSLVDLGTGVAREGCSGNTDGVLSEIAKWLISGLLSGRLGDEPGEAFSIALDAASEIGKETPCSSVTDWLNAFLHQMLRQGYEVNGIVVESPVYPLVVNGAGQQAGFLENGQVVEEIPGSRVAQIGEKRMILYAGQSIGEVHLVGYAAGTMNLYATFTRADGGGVTLSYENVQTAQGMRATLDSADSRYMLTIDINGDDRVDLSLTPDKVEQITTRGEALPQPAPASTSSRSSGTMTPVIIVAIVGLVVASGIILVLLSNRRLASASVPYLQVTRGQAARPVTPLRHQALVLGRDPHCNLVLPDPKVSHRHAQIVSAPSGYVLTDLGSANGTFVNGQQVKQKTLRPGDMIRVGNTELVFQLPAMGGLRAVPRQPATAGPARGYLVAGAERYSISAAGGEIGRARPCAIVVSDPQVSSRHARLDWRGDTCVITDLGSANGTFVNGKQVKQKTLRPGDVIRVGSTELVFQLPGMGGIQAVPRKPATTGPARGHLVVGTERYPIPALGGEIGRDAHCAIVLSDPQVSAHHARLDWQGNTCVLTDLGSANGTYVIGRRVTSQALRQGDEVRVGNTRMRFHAT